jgi:hypothetical protein
LDVVTNSQAIMLEMGLDLNALRMRFLFDDIRMDVGRVRIQLGVERPEDVLLERIRTVALRLLTDL